jgi:hypothetical protein
MLMLGAKLDGGGAGGHVLVPLRRDETVGAIYQGSARVVLGSRVHADVDVRGAIGVAIRHCAVMTAALVGVGLDTLDTDVDWMNRFRPAALASFSPLVQVSSADGDSYVVQASASLRSNGEVEAEGRIEWHRGHGVMRGASLAVAHYFGVTTIGLVGLSFGR